ncbi:MAG TPA: class I SAM-dependent methyltransferase [Vicinamibacterales bacterium]|nr:class I SAM-dependent methyltransferase [Vicinamibacterales bacterium]
MNPDDAIVDLYQRHADEFDRHRNRSLMEKAWLDRFVALVRRGGRVLDVGCGMGEPIGRYLLEAGLEVTGIDSSPALIDLCRTRLPAGEWIVGDMRALDLGRRFDGIVAWDSFFHLNRDAQRRMFPRFAAHAAPGAVLMFTSGPRDGEAIGTWCGEPLYHASLSPEEYQRRLRSSGFSLRFFLPNDPDCGEHTVWVATCGAERGRDVAP